MILKNTVMCAITIFILAACNKKAPAFVPNTPPLSSIDEVECASAMAKLDDTTLKQWLKGIKDKCSTLDAAAQASSAKGAEVQRSGRVIFYPYSQVIELLKAGKLPYVPVAGSPEEETLAMQGVIQAQRNLAATLVHQGNEQDACAWRMTIVQSGNKNVNDSDVALAKTECAKLDALHLNMATAKSAELLKNF